MDMDMRDCAAKAPQGFPRNRNNQRFFVFKFLIENKNDGFEEFGVVGIQNQMWVLSFWLVFFFYKYFVEVNVLFKCEVLIM